LPQELDGSQYYAVYQNIKTVGGSTYAVGDPYRLYKRIDVDEWQNLTQFIDLPDAYLSEREGDEHFGWQDLDGFSEQDMYLVGGRGEVWHFDGEGFNQHDFPSDEELTNVCCAGDGFVYVVSSKGHLWRGKGDTCRWIDIVWFNNQLLLSSEFGLYQLRNDEVVGVDAPARATRYNGALSISPDNTLLLSAGNGGASLYDGTEWTVLFERP